MYATAYRSMKWHNHLTLHLIKALQDCFESDYYADKVIEWHFKRQKKWGSRDRRFFAENYYELVRYWRKYVVLSGHSWSCNLKLPPESYNLILATFLYDKYGELPDCVEFKEFSSKKFEARKDELTDLKEVESIPDWLQSMGTEIYQKKWPDLLHQLNTPAVIYLRANTLKATVSEVVRQLKAEGVAAEPCPEAGTPGIKLLERKNVFILEPFKKGLFEVQDLGSQVISEFLKVEKGQRVLDACAGAGGKTLHIAALMKNKGKVIASDIHEWKLKELRRRSSRAGVDIIECKLLNQKLIKRLAGSIDRVLLDVPCSGLGVLRRNPDTKWKFTPERLEELIKIQQEILLTNSRVLEKGGVLVYATCSLLPQENQDQVQWFLNQSPGVWKLDKEQQLLPDQFNSDAFYMARILRVK